MHVGLSEGWPESCVKLAKSFAYDDPREYPTNLQQISTPHRRMCWDVLACTDKFSGFAVDRGPGKSNASGHLDMAHPANPCLAVHLAYCTSNKGSSLSYEQCYAMVGILLIVEDGKDETQLETWGCGPYSLPIQ